MQAQLGADTTYWHAQGAARPLWQGKSDRPMVELPWHTVQVDVVGSRGMKGWWAVLQGVHSAWQCLEQGEEGTWAGQTFGTRLQGPWALNTALGRRGEEAPTAAWWEAASGAVQVCRVPPGAMCCMGCAAGSGADCQEAPTVQAGTWWAW